MAQNLSKVSIYEQLFKTRHRRPGRPVDSDGDVLFPSGDNHPLIVRLAERRAFAVVHEENRDRLSSVFAQELRVLKARGLEQVAEDANIDLDAISAARDATRGRLALADAGER